MLNEPKQNKVLKIPKLVFIVPYRNRVQQKFFFSKYMTFLLEDNDNYEIYFTHQCDARTFNRGAVKNIGFIAVRNKYPDNYKDITFVFNDVDTMPFHKILDYSTTTGVVKHFYGYTYTLGGIVSIKGSDFEKTNGYPCFWGWGMEDNTLQKRCEAIGLQIDRSVFFNIGSPEILQLFDGISRIISKKDTWRAEHDTGVDGLRTITKLKYTIDETSLNPNDNIYTVDNPNIMIINIGTFLTHIQFGTELYHNYDLREPKRGIINPNKLIEPSKIVIQTEDWSNIPYYPTTAERNMNTLKYLLSTGKQVPKELVETIKQDKKKEIESETNISQILQTTQPQSQIIHPTNRHHNSPYPTQVPQTQVSQTQVPPNKYSHQYASYIGLKPKAQASARIGLGGIY